MDKLSQISVENTVTLKIDCLLNQELLAKNFNIVMDCLNDLQSQIRKHSDELSGLSGLKDNFDKLSQEVKQNTIMLSNLDKNTQNAQGQITQPHDQTQLDSLHREIKELKERMAKGETFTTENTKDINLLNSDMKNANSEIENLKKLFNDLNSTKNNGSNSNASNSENNLGKNHSLSQDILNGLNQQSQEHSKTINKFEKEMDEMRKHIKNLQDQIARLKLNLNQVLEDSKAQDNQNNTNQNNTSQNSNSEGVTNQKALTDMMKKIQYLTKKTENIQSQVLNNTRCIHELNETTEKNSQEIDEQKDSIDNIHIQIQQINKILEQLQNNDSNKVLSDIDKLKDMYEKLLKMINGLKNSNKSESDPSHLDERNSSSNRNITSKASQDRSFKKRSDSVDLTGRIRQLSDRIKHLQKLIGQQNPQKLPTIGWKKPNQTSYNGQKSHKKDLTEMKNELQIWIKSYIDSQNKGHGNLTEIQLKIQEIKNILARKADHEGMKKGLAFLEGKITQLYLFLTEPESEDAMIVRKGFNCLSCSKKVENLRGKLGPRMNWDNLNTNHHGHTPPKVGFPKYADSNQKESI